MRTPRSFDPVFLERLAELHGEIDARAGELAAVHGPLLVCRRGCSDCCQDGLTVLEIEAAGILAHRDRWAEPQAVPHPQGRCAFLTVDGACRIYPWRPYVCRTQGLPLRWLEEESPAHEGRSICPLNEREFTRAGVALADLGADRMWTLGEMEGRLASLQAEAAGEFALVRIPLRDLFG